MGKSNEEQVADLLDQIGVLRQDRDRYKEACFEQNRRALNRTPLSHAENLERMARVAHEVNREYCFALGDDSQLPWDDAPEWQRSSARMGVDLHTMGDFGPEASHISWMKQKLREGWVYGKTKDPVAKTHPCLIPFDQLPREQQAKDFIFRAIVHALR